MRETSNMPRRNSSVQNWLEGDLLFAAAATEA